MCAYVTASEYDFHFEAIMQNREPSIIKVTHLRLSVVFQIHDPIYRIICGTVRLNDDNKT